MTTGKNHSRIRMKYLHWAVSAALHEKYQGTFFTSKVDSGEVNTLLTFEMEQKQALTKWFELGSR